MGWNNGQMEAKGSALHLNPTSHGIVHPIQVTRDRLAINGHMVYALGFILLTSGGRAPHHMRLPQE